MVTGASSGIGAATATALVEAGFEVVVGAREMRTMGIEAAYAVRESSLDVPSGAVTADELARTAARVARSWTW